MTNLTTTDTFSNRLKNIEETEKAKRAMMEDGKTVAPKKLPEATDFAAARCEYRGWRVLKP